MRAALALLLAGGGADSSGVLVRARDEGTSLAFAMEQPAFRLDSSESLHPALAPRFTATFVGRLLIERASRYRFFVVARGGTATLRVGAREPGGAPVELPAGELPIEVSFERAEGPALLRIEWSSDFFAREPLPARFLHRDPDPALAALERGRLLAEERGCARCHERDGPDGPPSPSRVAPDLTHVGARTNAAWIERWLADPRALRPRAGMPALPLDGSQRRDVAAYLATTGARPDAKLPVPSSTSSPVSPASTNAEADGAAAFADVGCLACHEAGGADLGDLRAKTDEAALVARLLDPLAIDPSGRMPALFDRSGARAESDAALARAIARHLLAPRATNDSTGPSDAHGLPPPDVARGQELVRYSGCLRCHDLRAGETKERRGARLPDESSAPAWRTLDPTRGCLADEPPAAPDFGLAADERDALRTFVAFARDHPDRSAAPAYELARSVARFGCANCHDAHRTGRPLAELPPPLEVVGAKMRSSWLEGVLCGGTRVRPWMRLRMPDFGAENVRPLVAQFAAASGVEPGEGASEPLATREERLAGVALLGAEGGLSCIGCHDFRDYESIGARGPDLTRMHARLRPEWFELWMRQPLRLIPGTSMPRYFEGAGADEHEEAETRAKLARIWAGLQFGEAMPPPPGLVASAQDTGRSQPARRPLLQRTFMPDSSPASIALALPRMVNCCFDTVECRVRYAWDGDFLDMRPQWAVKGEQLPKLLGPIFWRTTSDFGVRIGDAAGAPTLRFRGHRVRDGMPELYYDVSSGGEVVGGAAAPVRPVRIDERIEAAPSGLGLVHRYRVGECALPIRFLARGTVGGTVTLEGDGARLESEGCWLVGAQGPLEFTVVIAATEAR